MARRTYLYVSDPETFHSVTVYHKKGWDDEPRLGVLGEENSNSSWATRLGYPLLKSNSRETIQNGVKFDFNFKIFSKKKLNQKNLKKFPNLNIEP